MEWIKQHLSIKRRLSFLKHGIGWLAITVIDTHAYDEERWYRIPFPFIDRWQCFLSCLETTIIGYVYRLKDV